MLPLCYNFINFPPSICAHHRVFARCYCCCCCVCLRVSLSMELTSIAENRLLKKFTGDGYIMDSSVFITHSVFIHDHGWMNKNSNSDYTFRSKNEGESARGREREIKSVIQFQSSVGTFAKVVWCGRCKKWQIINEADKGVFRVHSPRWKTRLSKFYGTH